MEKLIEHEKDIRINPQLYNAEKERKYCYKCGILLADFVVIGETTDGKKIKRYVCSECVNK